MVRIGPPGSSGTGGTSDGSSDSDSGSSGSSSSPGPGGRNRRSGPTGGSSSVGSSDPDPIRERISGGFNSARNTVSDAAEPVTSRIDTVSDALPGRTGEAFAAGVGVAAIPEPTPVTETGGAAIAGGAALVGGGVLASRALRNRGSEIGIGERVTNELDVGRSRRDATEVGIGERITSELGISQSRQDVTEVGVGDPTASTGEVAAPTVETAQVTGQFGEQQEEDDEVIGGSDIIIDDRTGEIARQQYEQSQYEVQERYGDEVMDRVPEAPVEETPGQINDIGEGISGVGNPESYGQGELIANRDFSQFIENEQPPTNRDPVRFPAEEAVGGGATGLGEELAPDFGAETTWSLATATGAGAGSGELFAGAGREQDDAGGIGDIDLANDTTGITPGQGFETGAGTGSDIGSDTDTDTDTDVTTDTGTDTGTGVSDTVTVGEQAVTIDGQAVTDTVADAQPTQTPQQFGQPEQSLFESPTPAQGFGSGSSGGGRNRDPPRPPIPSGGDDDDSDATAFGTDESVFGSGIADAEDLLNEFERL